MHWNGQTWRLLPPDFNIASHYRERYGADFVPADLSIQDWGVTYDELEPHFDRFERLCGIGGRAGNLRGTRQPGGNPFEGWRSREFPNPPSDPAYAGALFGNATAQLGYTPFQVPTANMTRAYTNPEGLQPQPCSVCGFCERFGCEHYAKASPETVLLPRVMAYRDFELRTHAHVTKITIGGTPRMATGVVYVDGAGAEIEQPASLVLLCAYGLNNGQLLLNSGIGTPYDPATRSGTIGRNYAYQTIAAVAVFYRDDVRINPFMGAWALGTAIDDFNGDNFDHSDVGFVGGAYVAAFTTGGRPIEHHPVPPGTPRWGSAWKGSVKRHYNHTVGLTVHGSSMSTPHNYLSRDPTYRDKYGQPSLRITFDFPDNDVRMANFVLERTVEIARLMGGDVVAPASRTTPYSVVPYRTTHNTGGAVMGVDPTRSAVNRYLQS